MAGVISAEQQAGAERIRWRLGLDNGTYVSGRCPWRGVEYAAIHFTTGAEAGEVYVWRTVGGTPRWYRVGPTVRGRFEQKERHA